MCNLSVSESKFSLTCHGFACASCCQVGRPRPLPCASLPALLQANSSVACSGDQGQTLLNHASSSAAAAELAHCGWPFGKHGTAVLPAHTLQPSQRKAGRVQQGQEGSEVREDGQWGRWAVAQQLALTAALVAAAQHLCTHFCSGKAKLNLQINHISVNTANSQMRTGQSS